MKIKVTFLMLFATLFLVDNLAFARAGGRSMSFGGGRSSSSFSNQGSRGTRTFEGGNAGGKSYDGMNKTTTAKPDAANPAAAANNPANNPINSKPSFFQQHPMMSMFGGALAGTALGAMLFGGSGVGGMAGAGGSGGILSSLLPILLIGLLIYFAVKFFSNRAANNGQNNIQAFGNNNAQANANLSTGSVGGVAPAVNAQNIKLDDSEMQKFADLLIEVQSAWSVQDMERLKKSVTPEIYKYFSDALAQNQSQDLQNKVENVKVLAVDVNEAWQEDDMQYATAVLEWSAIDYTFNVGKNITDPAYVSEGDMKNPSNISEAWTFARYGTGRWILTAIAQVN